MDTENYNDIHINELRKEYKRIDSEWLMLHYKVSIGLVIFACVVECFMGIILIHSDMMTTTVNRFVWKFIVAPSGINFICIGIERIVIRAKYLLQSQKIYMVSLVFVFISFVLFTAHSAFSATYYIFGVAIILTTIYANYRLTFITALLSATALIVSELFIKWDLDKESIFGSTLRLSNFLISLFILIACSIVSMVKIRYQQKKNGASIQMEIERQQLKQRLQLDEMTGIFNRKALHDAMRDMEENAAHNNYIFAIVDVDNFKSINDKWGHHVGDRCLIEFAKILNESCEKANAFRYGGDEFCLLFQNADMAEAVLTCEKIQYKLSSLCIKEQPMQKLTASFGIAMYSDQLNAAKLFINADQALYEAKEVRNTIRIFSMV